MYACVVHMWWCMHVLYTCGGVCMWCLPLNDLPAYMGCRHAEVMKKIMTMIEEDGRQLEVHSYPY